MHANDQQNSPPEPLMNPMEVAKFLHVSKATVMRMVHERGLPVIRLGGSFRFRRLAVEAWIETQSQEMRQ